jgi:hypothetical protein
VHVICLFIAQALYVHTTSISVSTFQPEFALVCPMSRGHISASIDVPRLQAKMTGSSGWAKALNTTGRFYFGLAWPFYYSSFTKPLESKYSGSRIYLAIHGGWHILRRRRVSSLQLQRHQICPTRSPSFLSRYCPRVYSYNLSTPRG